MTLVLTVLSAAPQARAGEAVIRLVGYSPQQARDLALPTQRSMPLQVVGVGQPVYLESVHQGTYAWSLSAPDSSSAALSSTVERRVYLVPDLADSFVVTLAYTSPEGVSSTAEITITGAEYVGVDADSGDTSELNCSICHKGEKADWELTGHAGVLQRGLDGISSVYYEESCLQCHTVGYDTLAVDRGFDDRAAAEGWSFPDSLYQGLYDELAAAYPNTFQLAGVQCESCHGPGSLHGGLGPIAVSYDAGVCAYCHDELEASGCGCLEAGAYYFTEQWRHSAHGKDYRPEELFNAPGPGCVACHTAEGFFEVNLGGEHLSTSPYKSFHGITCTVCHDPHEAVREYQLRVAEDYLSQDASGKAKYKSGGSAATACDICHHLTPGTDTPGTRPHYSHQTDVLNNRAGYRYPGKEYPAVNDHSLFVPGRCAGCHMAFASPEKKEYVGGHTFSMYAPADPDHGGPSEDLYLTGACIGCHGTIGENFDYQGIQTRVDSLLDLVKSGLVLYGEESPDSLRGSPRYSREDVEAGIITEQQKNAAYNWYVFSRDGSRGVHNPALTLAILEHALEDLNGPRQAPSCDFNGDGRISISDVIALLLFQRANPEDPRGDFNGDGKVGISDAIALLLAMRDGTCPDGSAVLSAAGYLEAGDGASGLGRADAGYIEEMMPLMGLTAEEEAAFRAALYGKAATAGLPGAFALGQNSPNPFNPATAISYSVPGGDPVRVRLEVFDIRGRLVRTLVDGTREAGTYSVFWDGTGSSGSRAASGVYLYRMTAGNFVSTRKMVLVK